MEKNCFSDWRKVLRIQGWRSRIYKNIQITRTIFETLLTCYWRFLLFIETIEITIGTNNWDVETYRKKLENLIIVPAGDLLMLRHANWLVLFPVHLALASFWWWLWSFVFGQKVDVWHLFLSLHQPATKNQLPNTKCQPKFLDCNNKEKLCLTFSIC